MLKMKTSLNLDLDLTYMSLDFKNALNKDELQRRWASTIKSRISQQPLILLYPNLKIYLVTKTLKKEDDINVNQTKFAT